MPRGGFPYDTLVMQAKRFHTRLVNAHIRGHAQFD
jgi:hypothetical protein